MTIDDLLNLEESQTFDRKSIGIRAVDLSQHICAFANADGGCIAIGITDRERALEGVDEYQEKVNDLLRVPIDYCKPSVPIRAEMIPCIDRNGNNNHILLFHIEASASMHANQQDEVFLRVGDKSKKLGFEDRLSLMYDKGLRLFENTLIPDSSMQDIDLPFLNGHLQKIGYGKSAEEYLLQNRSFAALENGIMRLSASAILLFGLNPQHFFPRARIRFIRYEGNEAKTGTEMNVIKDVVFESKLLDQVRNAVAFVKTQIKEHTYLGTDGRFVTKSEYPEFVFTELIVNAVTHRDYAILGTDIQIRMFSNRLEFDSPGKLPGLVKPDNIRYTHFSRNPSIAEFLKQYSYVKEYGEGIDRICRELKQAGLPEIKINNDVFVLKATVYNATFEKPEIKTGNPEIQAQNPDIEQRTPDYNVIIARLKEYNYNKQTQDNAVRLFSTIKRGQIFSSADVAGILHCAMSTASEMIRKLKEAGLIEEVAGLGKGKCRIK